MRPKLPKTTSPVDSPVMRPTHPTAPIMRPSGSPVPPASGPVVPLPGCAIAPADALYKSGIKG
jgi:hypothetical protein